MPARLKPTRDRLALLRLAEQGQVYVSAWSPYLSRVATVNPPGSPGAIHQAINSMARYGWLTPIEATRDSYIRRWQWTLTDKGREILAAAHPERTTTA